MTTPNDVPSPDDVPSLDENDSDHDDSGSGDSGSGDSAFGDKVDALFCHLQQLVREAEPLSVSGNQARSIVASFAEIERAAASGVALFTPRVVATGSFAKEGHGSAPEWLGSLSGTSAAKAKGRLAAAERAAADPRLTEALHESELSPDQLGVVVKTASEVPEATESLLDLIGQGASQQEVSDTAARLRAAKRSRETERVRRARVHSQRHFRWHQDENGGIRGEFFSDEIAWARVAPRLEAEAKARWKAAGAAAGDSLEAHRMDALIDILGGSGGEESGNGGAATGGGGGGGDGGDGGDGGNGSGWGGSGGGRAGSRGGWGGSGGGGRATGAPPGSRRWSSSTPQPCAGARPKVTSCVRSRASGRSRSSPPPSSSPKAACAT